MVRKKVAIKHSEGASLPRTLLVVGGDVRGEDAGEVFLRDAMRQIPRDRLVRCSLMAALPNESIRDWQGFAHIADMHPSQGVYPFFQRRPFRRFATFLLYFIQRVFVIPRVAKRILVHICQLEIQRVVVVLNSPQLIYLAACLIKMGQDISALVWDPPERFAVDQFFPGMLRQMLLADFANVIHSCASLATASDGMRAEYVNRYKKDSVVLIHGVEHALHEQIIKSTHSKNSLLIGFAGNLYAITEWDALLNALASVSWQIAGRQVEIHILGSGLTVQRSHPKTRIHYWGWRNVQETIQFINGMDIAYLPYWLDEKYRYATQMCFPNKIPAYLAAGVPILYHGPSDGSPARFLANYPAGIGCHTTDSADIVKTLERFVREKDFYPKAAIAIEKARAEEYNLDVFESRFLTFLTQPLEREK